MKMILRLMLVALVVVVAAPSHAAEPWHVHQCEILDDTTEDHILEGAAKWLKAAKAMKGGESLEMYVFFPVAAEMGASDFRVLLRASSFQEWGTFWDGYHGSPAAKIDDENNVMADCPDSWLFEGMKIK